MSATVDTGAKRFIAAAAAADALFCVVEGGVRLINADGREVEVGPRGRFGVGEILSGTAAGPRRPWPHGRPAS